MKMFKFLALVLSISLTGLFLLSCEKETATENFHGFSLKNAQETYTCQWNLDSLKTVYDIGFSSASYPLASVRVINSKEELFFVLCTDSSELSEKEREYLKKLPQNINVDFAMQSIVYFGLSGQVCNRVMATIHHEENSYSIRVLSYLPDDWCTNWFADTMACSVVFPRISSGATFSIETVEIEGGSQEASRIMANEDWFDIKN